MVLWRSSGSVATHIAWVRKYGNSLMQEILVEMSEYVHTYIHTDIHVYIQTLGEGEGRLPDTCLNFNWLKI